MAFNETVLAGVIGGLITSIAIPLTSYFGLRLLNCCFVDIKVEERNETIGYTVFNIRVRNRSLATLKKVTARVSIDNYNNDIIKESRIEIFCLIITSKSVVILFLVSIVNTKNYPICFCSPVNKIKVFQFIMFW